MLGLLGLLYSLGLVHMFRIVVFVEGLLLGWSSLDWIVILMIVSIFAEFKSYDCWDFFYDVRHLDKKTVLHRSTEKEEQFQ